MTHIINGVIYETYIPTPEVPTFVIINKIVDLFPGVFLKTSTQVFNFYDEPNIYLC